MYRATLIGIVHRDPIIKLRRRPIRCEYQRLYKQLYIGIIFCHEVFEFMNCFSELSVKSSQHFESTLITKGVKKAAITTNRLLIISPVNAVWLSIPLRPAMSVNAVGCGMFVRNIYLCLEAGSDIFFHV